MYTASAPKTACRTTPRSMTSRTSPARMTPAVTASSSGGRRERQGGMRAHDGRRDAADEHDDRDADARQPARGGRRARREHRDEERRPGGEELDRPHGAAVRSDQGEDGEREREQQDAAVAEAPGAVHLRCLAHEATLPSASSSPGASTRTSTSGASSATWRAKTRGGSTSALPRSASRPTGKNVPQWIGTAMRRAHDRHRARRAQRVHVPGPERRPPAPDRQQGDVEAPREAPHPLEELRVAREVDALGAGDLVAQRRDGRAQRAAAAVVDRRQRRDGGVADGDAVAGRDLVDLGEADAPQQPSGSLRAR